MSLRPPVPVAVFAIALAAAAPQAVQGRAGQSGPAPSATPSPGPSSAPRPPEASHDLGVKYVRDSAEYQALTRMIYRLAAEALERAARERAARKDASLPAVVLDVDETALDNSVYELERSAYGLPFAGDSWDAWVQRRAAGAVPGAREFVQAARAKGVRVVWITDRDSRARAATRDNLRGQDLWDEADLLCVKTGPGDDKAARRKALRAGEGACSLGRAAQVLVYLGDQMTDFPADGESEAGAEATDGFGRSRFLLPNPMYGRWTGAVTRRPAE